MQPEQFYKSVPSVVHPDKGTLVGAKKGETTDTCNSTVNFKCITQKERSQTQKLYDPFLWNSGKCKTTGTENRSVDTMGCGWRSPSRWGKLHSYPSPVSSCPPQPSILKSPGLYFPNSKVSFQAHIPPLLKCKHKDGRDLGYSAH